MWELVKAPDANDSVQRSVSRFPIKGIGWLYETMRPETEDKTPGVGARWVMTTVFVPDITAP